MRGVTNGFSARQQRFGFQLTRLMRGVTNCFLPKDSKIKISTHTPHARRDQRRYK